MSFAMNKKELAAHAMKQAMAWLDEHGIHYLSLPPYQLKIDAINFWPKTGTITIDGDPQRRPEKGLSGLESLLNAKGMIGDQQQYCSPIIEFKRRQ